MALGNSLKYKTYHMYNIQKQYFVNFLLYNYERYYHPSKKKKCVKSLVMVLTQSRKYKMYYLKQNQKTSVYIQPSYRVNWRPLYIIGNLLCARIVWITRNSVIPHKYFVLKSILSPVLLVRCAMNESAT
jgi:hypothetical protein